MTRVQTCALPIYLEAELEEQETKGLETELHHRAQSEDLNQRVQALEKQLKHNRQFIDVSVPPPSSTRTHTLPHTSKCNTAMYIHMCTRA